MKTNRKYLARSFTKIAKRWDDSKKTTENLRKHGFKSARQWGREMANMYFDELASMCADSLSEMLEEAMLCDQPITQEDFDYFAFEEVTNW
nr:MAG TPA: hypothetical protein [Caudoviricetes sp.]